MLQQHVVGNEDAKPHRIDLHANVGVVEMKIVKRDIIKSDRIKKIATHTHPHAVNHSHLKEGTALRRRIRKNGILRLLGDREGALHHISMVEVTVEAPIETIKHDITTGHTDGTDLRFRKILLHGTPPVVAVKYNVLMHKTEELSFCATNAKIISLKDVILPVRVVYPDNLIRHANSLTDILRQIRIKLLSPGTDNHRNHRLLYLSAQQKKQRDYESHEGANGNIKRDAEVAQILLILCYKTGIFII